MTDALLSDRILNCFRCGNDGCDVTCTVAEYWDHMARCGFRDEDTCEGGDTCPQCGELLPDTGPATRRGHQQLVCPHSAVACTFLSVGCDTRLAR